MAQIFMAGAASGSIMPRPEAVDNSLHPQMTVRLDEVGSPLEVKVLALSLGDRSVVLVVLDAISIPQPSGDWLREAVAAATGLARGDILISCTHSHSTPFLESLDRPHPYLDQVTQATVDAAGRAWEGRRPARFGHARRHVVGASINSRVHLPDGRVKFTRDYREGLASGRPIDPRLNILRVDGQGGRPIAGWLRFAAHPACVVFDAPISAEYPGYLTTRLRETVGGGAPFLYAFGAAGDVNCVPMFGSESDSRNLGLNLSAMAGPLFESIQTRPPRRLLAGTATVHLPLDSVPTVESLDREIELVEAFIAGLDKDPSAVWLLGSNAGEQWTLEKKRAWAQPMGQWCRRMKEAIAEGRTFPTTWPSEVTAVIIDDIGLLYYSGEPLTQIGLDIAARSCLPETLVISHTNGWNGYLGTDEDRHRGGYETANWHRMFKPRQDIRPLPYALGAAEVMIKSCLGLFERLVQEEP